MAGLTLLLSLLPVALAFSDTVPLVAWSSHSSSTLDKLPHTSSSFDSVQLLDTILLSTQICKYDAVVLIDQPGLHASDLRTLPSTSHVARSLFSSPSPRQYAYVPSSLDPNVTSDSVFSPYASTIAATCHSRLVSFTPGQGALSFDTSDKYTIVLNMPSLETGPQRKRDMREYGDRLSSTLASILTDSAAPFPNHLVVYTGSAPAASASKRHLLLNPPALSPLSSLSSLSSRSNSRELHARAPNQPDHPKKPIKSPKTGLLHTHQLLTPGLIITLLVSLLVLLPITVLGIRALASIQSPLMRGERGEAPRGWKAGERKNQ